MTLVCTHLIILYLSLVLVLEAYQDDFSLLESCLTMELIQVEMGTVPLELKQLSVTTN